MRISFELPKASQEADAAEPVRALIIDAMITADDLRLKISLRLVTATNLTEPRQFRP